MNTSNKQSLRLPSEVTISKGYWVALYTLVAHEWFRFIRIWPQTLLPPAVTTVLYFVIFGTIIGSQISDIEGFDYVAFIAPGLVLMTAITNSYGNVVASFYSSRFHGNIDELLVSPMPNYIILTGFVVGGVLRGVTVAAIVTVSTILFTPIIFNDFALALFVMVLTCILFSLAGFINGIYAKSFDGIAIVPTFVLMPLTYLGGVFYSVEILPEFWQQISLVNPIFYMLNAYREATIGVSDVVLSTALWTIAGFIVALVVYCLILLDRGVGIRR